MDSPRRVGQCRAYLVLLPEVKDIPDSDGVQSVLAMLQHALFSPPTAEEKDEEDDLLTYNLTMPHCSNEYLCMLLATDWLKAKTDVFVRGRLSSGAQIHVYTSHRDNLTIVAAQRELLFKHIMAACRSSAPEGATAILGGDTNLREYEVHASNVALAAAWLRAGADELQNCTRDTTRNNNIESSNAVYAIQERYARIFLLPKPSNFPRVVSFSLIGTEQLDFSGKFISYPFGLCCDIVVQIDSQEIGC